MKWTSFALFGASGVGKTSLLNLLLRKEPVTEHHSTPVAKAPEIRLVSKEEHDDEGQVIMSDESCFWTSTDPETMKIKFLQAIKYHVRTQSDETEPQELQESNEDQVKNTSREKIESVEQTPLTSHVTPKKKPHDSLPTDHSPDEEQLQSMSGVQTSKEKPLLTSQVTPKKTPHDSLPTDHSPDEEQLQSMLGVQESKEKPLLTSPVTPKKKRHDSLPTDHSPDEEQLQSMSGVQESKEKPLLTSQVTPKKKPHDSLPTDRSPDEEQLQSISEVQESKEKPLLTSPVTPVKKPSESLSTDPSTLNKELLQLITEVKKSDELYNTHMMYGVDLGGQAAFLDIAPALLRYHSLNMVLFRPLHFPGILSHVVFLDPQVLFDMLSQIIAVSYGDDRYDDATIKSLKTKGIFKRELLDTMEFEEDVFSCDDFLKLMEGLLIISHIPNDTTYFIPCVLDIIDDPFEDSSGAIEPLYLTWDDELIPNGLFTSLVVFLMGHVSPTQFKLVNYFYRNKVVLRCQHFGGALHLLDQVKSLTIRYFGPSRHCFNIRRMIHQGIESIVHKFGWTDSLASTQERFRCKIEGCTNRSFHLCHLISEHEEMLCCDVSNVKFSADKTRHLSWFHEGMML